MNRFLGALQFLTVLPIARSTSTPGEAAVWFPMVGALLGLAAGLVLRYGGALFAILFLTLATGCLHEDGLADCADAFRAGRSRERILAILKDSRIGTYGAMALIAAFAMRWQALGHMRAIPFYTLPAALALSRCSMVMLAAVTPPAGDGLGRAFTTDITRGVAWGALLQAVAMALAAGVVYGAAMIAASAVVTMVARAYFVRRLGGVTGDCLGATCQAVETLNLAILTWQPSW